LWAEKLQKCVEKGTERENGKGLGRETEEIIEHDLKHSDPLDLV